MLRTSPSLQLQQRHPFAHFVMKTLDKRYLWGMMLGELYFFCQLKIGIYVWSSINYPNSTSNYLTVIPTSKRNSGSSPTICANPKTSLATVCSVCCMILIQCLCHIVFDTAHFLLKPRSRFLVICDVTGLFGLHPFNLRYSFAGRCQVWVHLKIWNINIKYSNDIYVP